MTRLPDLERELFRAADAAEHAARRRRWGRISLLAAGASLVLAAGAVAASQLLLPEGVPVPRPPQAERVNLPRLEPGSARVLGVRAADPEGGLPWGIAVTRSEDGNMLCSQVGRVQDGKLGVIGRDGTFDNDGRFHPLAPDSNQGGSCGGIAPDGDFKGGGDFPPIPSSGYTGGFLGPAGGCREDVPGNTMSKQTRRKLKEVPICDADSLRKVKYGFAGRAAKAVKYGRERVRVSRDEYGAYLFVLKPEAARGARLTITYRDGRRCTQFSRPRTINGRITMERCRR